MSEDALAHYAEREFSEETARAIDRAVRELVGGAFEKALSTLRRYRGQLDEGAKLLLEKETLTRDELPALEQLEWPRRPVRRCDGSATGSHRGTWCTARLGELWRCG